MTDWPTATTASRANERGRVHRPRWSSYSHHRGQVVYGTQCDWNGRWAVELLPVEQTVRERRCRHCWPEKVS